MNRIKDFFDSKTKIIVAVVIALACIIGISMAIASQFKNETLIRGVDVSAYQGTIDWKKLADQDLYFAYIKATEGTDYKDKQFDTNWEQARKTKLKVGAYMFVDLNEDGKKQAEFFTQTVSVQKNSLPPVIDLELSSDMDETNMPSADSVQQKVSTIISVLKDKYDQTPIIYTNYQTYNAYMANYQTDVKIWICDLSNQKPDLSGQHQWVFWQYTQRGILNGYDGDEQFIDLDLFNGDEKAFNKMFN